MYDDYELTERDRIMLRELSVNSRVSFTKLAKITRCSVVTATKMLYRLTEKLDIRFTLEVDMDRLGLSDRHILAIKLNNVPDVGTLRDMFKQDVYAQDVYLTEGNFDLLIFAAADTPINYTLWETDLAAKLSDYLPDLRPSEFVFPQLGYVPLNDSFVDFISEGLKTDKYDKQILRLLNGNCRVGYRDLSHKLGIKEDRIRYRLFRLMRKGIIRRFTIAVQNPGYGHLLSYFMRYKFCRGTTSNAFPQMRNHYMNEGTPIPALNYFPMIAPLSGSYRSFGMVFDKDKKASLYKGIKWHKSLLRQEQVTEKHAFVTAVIKGLLPLRNLDASVNYRFIWK